MENEITKVYTYLITFNDNITIMVIADDIKNALNKANVILVQHGFDYIKAISEVNEKYEIYM